MATTYVLNREPGTREMLERAFPDLAGQREVHIQAMLHGNRMYERDLVPVGYDLETRMPSKYLSRSGDFYRLFDMKNGRKDSVPVEDILRRKLVY